MREFFVPSAALSMDVEASCLSRVIIKTPRNSCYAKMRSLHLAHSPSVWSLSITCGGMANGLCWFFDKNVKRARERNGDGVYWWTRWMEHYPTVCSKHILSNVNFVAVVLLHGFAHFECLRQAKRRRNLVFTSFHAAFFQFFYLFSFLTQN